MGPWTHGVKQLGLTSAGDVEFGPEAALDHNEERLAFFDGALKGIPNGRRQRAPLRLFVLGGGSGRRTAAGRLDPGGQWPEGRQGPPPRTRVPAYFPHRGGLLAPTPFTVGAAWSRFLLAPPPPP